MIPEKVLEAVGQPTARNGVPWPKDPLEQWILAWLQTKAEHGYRWPEWAVAAETAEAVRAYNKL